MSKSDTQPAGGSPSRRNLLAALPVAAIGVGTLGTAAAAGGKGSPAETPVTFDDYATIKFEGQQIDLPEVVETYRSMLPPFWIGASILTKNHLEVRDLVVKIGDAEAEETWHRLRDAEEYFESCAKMMEQALLRFLAGSARAAKEGGAVDI